MSEIESLESTTQEYRRALHSGDGNAAVEADLEQLVQLLSETHDWSEAGARTIVALANQYGSFMLRNALALAIALGKEDGELGF